MINSPTPPSIKPVDKQEIINDLSNAAPLHQKEKFKFKKLLAAGQLIKDAHIEDKQITLVIFPAYHNNFSSINQGLYSLVRRTPSLAEKYNAPTLNNLPPRLTCQNPYNPSDSQEIINDFILAARPTTRKKKFDFLQLLATGQLIKTIHIQNNRATISIFSTYKRHILSINQGLYDLVRRHPSLAEKYLPPQKNNQPPCLTFKPPFRPDNGQDVINDLCEVAKPRQFKEFQFLKLLAAGQLIENVQIKGNQAILSVFPSYQKNYFNISKGLSDLIKKNSWLSEKYLISISPNQQPQITLKPSFTYTTGQEVLADFYEAAKPKIHKKFKFQKLLAADQLIESIQVEGNQAFITIFPPYQRFYYNINKGFYSLIKKVSTLEEMYSAHVNREQPRLTLTSNAVRSGLTGTDILASLKEAIPHTCKPWQALITNNNLIEKIIVEKNKIGLRLCADFNNEDSYRKLWHTLDRLSRNKLFDQYFFLNSFSERYTPLTLKDGAPFKKGDEIKSWIEMFIRTKRLAEEDRGIVFLQDNNISLFRFGEKKVLIAFDGLSRAYHKIFPQLDPAWIGASLAQSFITWVRARQEREWVEGEYEEFTLHLKIEKGHVIVENYGAFYDFILDGEPGLKKYADIEQLPPAPFDVVLKGLDEKDPVDLVDIDTIDWNLIEKLHQEQNRHEPIIDAQPSQSVPLETDTLLKALEQHLVASEEISAYDTNRSLPIIKESTSNESGNGYIMTPQPSFLAQWEQLPSLAFPSISKVEAIQKEPENKSTLIREM